MRWVAGGLGLVLFCCLGGPGALVAVALVSGALDREARWSAAVDAPPPADAPTSRWAEWVTKAVQTAVGAQGKALLAGDEDGFLAAVDPDAASLVSEHRKRFRVLRAMGLGVWRESVASDARKKNSGAWEIPLGLVYCFGEPSCEQVDLKVWSEWQVRDGQVVLTSLDHSESRDNGPRPWEVDDLKVVKGDRVIVAATKVNSWRLTEAVKAADQAAKVADEFGQWHTKPSRYVVFLAGPADWRDWYGDEQPDWAAAWAVSVTQFVAEVVVRTEVVRQSELPMLLTHELTHVSSLSGPARGITTDRWWMVEGIAEYAANKNKSLRSYDGYIPTRDYVRGGWDGHVAVVVPGVNASLEAATARYGISYLAIRRIAEKYGQAKMLVFWGDVIHEDKSLAAAATEDLGVPWTVVDADCARFIRGNL